MVAALITLVHSMSRPIQDKGESRSWRVLLAAFAICLTGPYGYVEVLTRGFSKPMTKAISEGYENSGVLGPMQYYKVVSYNGDSARVIAVGEEKQEWGGSDRPVIAMTLKREGDAWKPESYNVVYSDRLGKDRATLPPYW